MEQIGIKVNSKEYEKLYDELYSEIPEAAKYSNQAETREQFLEVSCALYRFGIILGANR